MEKPKFIQVSANERTLKKCPDCPLEVPYDLLNEEQAMINHSQTLTKLNSRGGLSPSEMIYNIERRKFGSIANIVFDVEADIKKLIKYINNYNINK